MIEKPLVIILNGVGSVGKSSSNVGCNALWHCNATRRGIYMQKLEYAHYLDVGYRPRWCNAKAHCTLRF